MFKVYIFFMALIIAMSSMCVDRLRVYSHVDFYEKLHTHDVVGLVCLLQRQSLHNIGIYLIIGFELMFMHREQKMKEWE